MTREAMVKNPTDATSYFHAQGGFYFSRTAVGSVRVSFGDSEVELDENTWASVVAVASVRGDTAVNHAAALNFHKSPTQPT